MLCAFVEFNGVLDQLIELSAGRIEEQQIDGRDGIEDKRVELLRI